MKFFYCRETAAGETRCSLVPDSVRKLVKAGADVLAESGIGASLGIADSDYATEGAVIVPSAEEGIAQADFVLRLRKPTKEQVAQLKPGSLHISYMDPFMDHGLVRNMAKAGVSAFSVEMIPRSTIAQKMDALSSQANLAGYVSVLVAAERLNKILPMMSTPAGTISPARVFVIGAGVAGLQAIATAKRLGARVDAFDTRPVVEEQVRSLGAKFVKIDLGETGQTKQGYARQLTEEQLALQREGQAKVCEQSDIVITTAQIFGRKAPVILTHDIVERMKPGSVIVDMAVETGGNVEGSRRGEEVEVNGVRIIGLENLPGRVPVPASEMYSSNLAHFVLHFWDAEQKKFQLKRDDDIIKSCLITHEGRVVNETIENSMKG